MLGDFMEKIVFTNYDVVFTSNFDILNRLKRKIVVTDSNIYKLNLHKQLGTEIELIVIKASETSKNIETVTNIIDKLNSLEVTTDDTLIAFGGGVVGDICGFVASIYKRGINYIQIPTTLLAMVDSSIGGKTGINFHKLKNCIGTFYDPIQVIVNTKLLKTLDEIHYYNGIFEIIKYGAIKDVSIIESLENTFEIDVLIKKAILVKKHYVDADYKDNGIRKILNFGHTIGHAIESQMCFKNILHGQAVAIGMLTMFDSTCDKIRIQNLYKKFGLCYTNYDINIIWQYILNDKKRNFDDTIDIVRVENLGKSYIKKVKIDDLYKELKGG